MYKDICLSNFRAEFTSYDRDNFSYEGLEVLYEYLIDLEEDCGITIELDIIALCCEYTEYSNIEEIQDEYTVKDIEEVRDNTTVLNVGVDGYILQDY